MNYTIFNKQTGEILKIVICAADDLQYQFDAGVYSAYAGNYSDESYYFVNDEPVLKPAKPSGFYSFDTITHQWVADEFAAKTYALEKRKTSLAASDWTQLPDVPLATKEAWATYRQELRDITAQSGYPFTIVWPTPPQ